MRVAVITPIPTPYRDPFWSRVAAHPLIDLDVYYCSDGKQDRPWEVSWPREFRWETLPGRNLLSWRGADASCFWNPEISSRLSGGRYDAIVIGGYNHPTMLSAVAFAERSGTPYFMMCETYRRGGARWKAAIKRMLVRHVMQHAAGTFPTGTLSGQYVLHYGAAPDRVVPIPNVPDVSALRAESMRLRESGEIRRDDDRPVVLFVARLIAKKRAGLLMRAFARARGAGDARLVIVGDGPERPNLEQLAVELGIADRVEFAGFTQPQDVVKSYSRASIFVLPSSETWGVSAIEALSCDVPVVVTDEVGCHPDVVTDARVGRVVKAREENELSTALEELLARPFAATEIASAWAPVRQSFQYDALAERMLGGLQNGLKV